MELLKLGLKSIHFTGLFNELLQLSHFQIVAIKTTVLVEYFGKDTQNGGLILVDRALGVDVKQDRIRRHSGAALQLRKHHRIVKLIRKIVNSLLSGNSIIGKKVRQHFQEVGFTASKEARDPNTDLISRNAQRLLIVIKKRIKMLTQLAGNDVLPQFLLNACLISLGNFNNTVNITVNIGFINIL